MENSEIVLSEKDFYKGNKNLLAPNKKVKITEKELKEIYKCYIDPIYFMEKYCTIIDPDKGKTIIKLRSYQKEKMLKKALLKNEKFIIILAPRQIGKSIILSIFAAHYGIFNEDKTIAVLANKEHIAKLQLSRIKLVFEQLPLWLKPGIKEWSKTSVELENGTKIICASTSSSSVRGESIQFLILDEFSFVPSNIQREFFSSVYPTIAAAKNSRIIIISTLPDVRSKKELEENLYWILWKNAKKGLNSYLPIEIYPHEIPGRDEKWKEETISNMGGDPEAHRRFKIEFENKIVFSDSKKLINNKTISKLTNNLKKWIILQVN